MLRPFQERREVYDVFTHPKPRGVGRRRSKFSLAEYPAARSAKNVTSLQKAPAVARPRRVR